MSHHIPQERKENSPKNVEQIYSDIWLPDLLDSLKWDSSLFSIRLNCVGIKASTLERMASGVRRRKMRIKLIGGKKVGTGRRERKEKRKINFEINELTTILNEIPIHTKKRK